MIHKILVLCFKRLWLYSDFTFLEKGALNWVLTYQMERKRESLFIIIIISPNVIFWAQILEQKLEINLINLKKRKNRL